MNKNFVAITDLDLYLTASGHVAFLNGKSAASTGGVVFRGYVVKADRSGAARREMTWLPSGQCIDGGDESDRIIARA